MGVDKKTTLMMIKVDLQCSRCYKKIKKVLCRIPQIQDQVYNEKENSVLIKVVCCSPEKIKQKIICKGGCAVKSIEIIEKPKEKPNPPPQPQPQPQPPPQPKPPPQPQPQPQPPPQPQPQPNPPPQPQPQPQPKPPPPPQPQPQPQPQCPPPCPPQLAYPVPFGTCCTECYEGRGGGPCYSGHGRPTPSYDGYYGRPIYDSYGGGGGGGGGGYRSSYVSPCDYFSEENSSGCSIM